MRVLGKAMQNHSREWMKHTECPGVSYADTAAQMVTTFADRGQVTILCGMCKERFQEVMEKARHEAMVHYAVWLLMLGNCVC